MRKGFTLIELLVVIFIIGLLAALVVVSVDYSRVKSRDAKRRADLKTLQTAIEQFNDKYMTYSLSSRGGWGWLNYDYTPGAIDPNDSTKTDNGNPMTALINAGVVNTKIKDPVATTTTNPYGDYMVTTSPTTYCFYAHLENIKSGGLCSGSSCWDAESSFGTRSFTTSVPQAFGWGPDTTYGMNYRIGIGC